MRLVVEGEVPSKKNARNVFVKNGRMMNLPSQRYKEWQKSAVIQFQSQFKGFKVTNYPIALEIVFYYGTKRRKDLDNSLGSIMDALTDAGVIDDDDVSHVSQITVMFGEYDKNRPRAEVYLDE